MQTKKSNSPHHALVKGQASELLCSEIQIEDIDAGQQRHCILAKADVSNEVDHVFKRIQNMTAAKRCQTRQGIGGILASYMKQKCLDGLLIVLTNC